MKGNKGITLIALIVTIIVLIILAGVAIAMLSGDNGILNRASEARYLTVVGSFDEQVKLAQIDLKATITSNMVSSTGYIATAGTNTNGNFRTLVEQVATDLGVAKTAINTASTEGFAVYSNLGDANPAGDATGYILITYSDNALRSSLPASEASNSSPVFAGTTYTTIPNTGVSVNSAVLAYVIKVTNYSCSLSDPALTNTSTVSTNAGSAIATAFASIIK